MTFTRLYPLIPDARSRDLLLRNSIAGRQHSLRIFALKHPSELIFIPYIVCSTLLRLRLYNDNRCPWTPSEIWTISKSVGVSVTGGPSRPRISPSNSTKLEHVLNISMILDAAMVVRGASGARSFSSRHTALSRCHYVKVWRDSGCFLIS